MLIVVFWDILYLILEGYTCGKVIRVTSIFNYKTVMSK